jgi:hypothetical protein
MTRQLIHRLTSLVLLGVALALFSVTASAQIPITYPANGVLSDYRPGSVLFYPKYTSNPSAPQQGDTQVNMTNTNQTLDISIHLFLVDGSSCSVADFFINLTPNQTASFLMSDLDPGVTGYIVGVATDGGPTQFNWLIGSESIRETDGRLATLQAIGVAKVSPGGVASGGEGTAILSFNGTEYERLPSSVGLDSFNSQVTDSTQVNLFVPASNLLSGIPDSTTRVFALLYDDVEHVFSTSISVACYTTFNVSSLRITGGINNIVPAGRTGWIRFEASGRPILGYAHTRGPVFNGGHNLHVLKLLGNYEITVPAF